MPAIVPAGPAAAMTAQRETGEEDGANDEHHAGDNRHPGSSLVDPAGTVFARRWRWDGCCRWFFLKCFSHMAIVAAEV
jgi:hypothetical protein